MGILRAIFARPEDGTKIIEGATAGLDKIFFTKEERADANNKLSEWYLKYLAATEGQNQARRLIALIVSGLWASLVILGAIARGFELWIQRGAAEISHAFSVYILGLLVDVVMIPFGIVIGFYFLTHTVRAYQKKD